MSCSRLLPTLLVSGTFWLMAAQAHDGPHAEAETQPVFAAPMASAVRHSSDGNLSVPKSVQRLLGLRTVIPAQRARTRSLLAEVQPQPDRSAVLFATEAGTLEAPAEGWLLPGTVVKPGQVLAWLRPAVLQKDRARRKAQQAEIEQRLAIATLNAERLRLQSAVTAEGGVATGNVYYEQMLAEQAGYEAQQAQLRSGLAARLPVVARNAGVLQDSPLRAGDVVSVGTRLFRLHDSAHLLLVAKRFEPLPMNATPVARWGPQILLFKGQQALDGARGWALQFDVQAAADLQAGELVEIEIDDAGPATWPAGACQRQADGSGKVWVHGAAERFNAVMVADCDRATELSGLMQARLVTQGASLLSAYLPLPH